MLLWAFAPAIVGGIFSSVMSGIGTAIGSDRHHNPGPLAFAFIGIGALFSIACSLIGTVIYTNKYIEFRYENTVIDGQRCKYVGTPGGLVSAMILPCILTACTLGIYSPWMYVKYWSWIYENVEVNGQRGRLVFQGDAGTLLGKFIVGMILTYCTLGIYGAWLVNDIFEFYWEGTKLDGRGFSFRKDPGGFLGTYIITAILSICTLYIYLPWGFCNILRWEAERVA